MTKEERKRLYLHYKSIGNNEWAADVVRGNPAEAEEFESKTTKPVKGK